VGHRPGRRDGPERPPERRLTLPVVLVAIGLVVIAVGVIWGTGAGAYGYWWLTNTAPPSLTVTAPTGPVRGTANVTVQAEPAGRAGPVAATVDGRPLAPGETIAVDTTSLPDGPHQLAVVAEDRSWRRNQTTSTVTLTTDNTPPQLILDAQPPQVQQGHTLLIRIRTNEPASVEARFGSQPVAVEPADGYGWVVIGFPPSAPTTTTPLVVSGRDTAGNSTEVQQTVEVTRYELPIDRVEVPDNLASLLQSDIRADEDRRLAPIYQNVTQPKLWDGRFSMPVTGQVITEFGTERSYNGGPVVSYHQGTDIAAPMGRPVLAPARGKVVFIDRVPLRGNMIVLDHGLGVFTVYGHLSSIDTQVGQTVEKGQPFAKVGSTGLSTGPHLHWEMWVDGANVDPVEWTERDVP
jgi:murein DD-endopeptidase MepM/ murein hydrolase activator NlpD